VAAPPTLAAAVARELLALAKYGQRRFVTATAPASEPGEDDENNDYIVTLSTLTDTSIFVTVHDAEQLKRPTGRLQLRADEIANAFAAAVGIAPNDTDLEAALKTAGASSIAGDLFKVTTSSRDYKQPTLHLQIPSDPFTRAAGVPVYVALGPLVLV
jgi:hypothetical protein